MSHVSIRIEQNTTERVMECNKGDKKFNLKDESGREQRERIRIFRKKQGKQINRYIREEQNSVEEQKKREDSRTRQG